MITIKLEGLDELKHRLSDMPRKVEIAAQRALLKTAQQIRDAEKVEMDRVFDRPTRWTLGAMKVKATSKFEVQVGIIDTEGAYKRAANYLGTQVGGGQRRIKSMEKSLQMRGLMPTGWNIVPGISAKLDAYGNISVGQIRQILSWFDAAENWAGSTQNMGFKGRDKRRMGTKRNARGFEYVVVMPDKKRNLKQPGIYRRGMYMGKGGSHIEPILIYVKASRYKARFNFEKVAIETANAVMQSEFTKAIELELAK